MSKLILDNVQGGYNLQKINSNFEKIETALNTQVLYRKNPEGEDNAVKQDIDMDGNDLINVGDVQVNGYGSFVEAIEDVEQARDDAEGFAQQAANSASQSASSALASSNSASQAAASAQQVEDAKLIWRGAWDSLTAYDVNDAVENDGTSYICILAHTNEEPPNASYWDVLAMRGADGAAGEGTGDVSSNTATSVDNEIALFSGTSGKIIKRAVSTGILKATSGVLSTAVGGTDYLRPSDFGIGGTAGAPVLPDLDAINTPVGFYRATSGTSNIASRPAGVSQNAIVLLERFDSNDLRQTYAPRGDHATAGRLFFREYDSVGEVWRAWKEVITDANIDQFAAGGWLPAAVFTTSGSYTLQAGREYFIVALGAGGCGARNGTSNSRTTGGNAGGLCAKSVSPSSNTALTIVVGAGSGRIASDNANNGIAGGDTTVTGTGISMTAPGGAGGVQGSGTQQPSAPATPTGGDINIAGGRAGAASGNSTITSGAAILGGNSADMSSTWGGWVTPLVQNAGATIPSVEFPSGIDPRIAFALNVAQAHSGAYVPVGVGGIARSLSDIADRYPLSFGAGSGGTTTSSGSPQPVAKAGDGVVIILEKV